MTAQEWIEAFAAEVGAAAPTSEEMDGLLALAGVAAHASERIAAPIACYLVGLSGRPIADARAAAERVGGQG